MPQNSVTGPGAYAPAEIAQRIEHAAIANMFFIPLALILEHGTGVAAGLDLAGFGGNLLPVTLGNIIGGGVFVALTCKIIYLRKPG